MKHIIQQLRQFYTKDFHPVVYGVSLAGITLLIIINYYFDFEDDVLSLTQGSLIGLFYHFIYFAIPYGMCICLYLIYIKEFSLHSRHLFKIIFLLALLSTKVWFSYHYQLSPVGSYQDSYLFSRISNRIVNLAFYVIGMLSFYKLFEIDNKNLYGFATKEFHWKPFVYLLLFMLPLLTWASVQADFLQTYPRLHPNAVKENYWTWFALFEPLYLLEFVGLEWFFRGFMVVGMVKLLGHRAILPMALTYCVFHFGKPMGECIGSLFGGYILGVISYYSRSIWGGVIVHMGVALLMDIFALISRAYSL